MSEASRNPESLASHMVCVAAGTRDGLRTAQFFVRALAGTEGWGRAPEAFGAGPLAKRKPRRHLLSGLISAVARFTDRAITWWVNRAIALLAPDWRKLPSPFTHGMMKEVSRAILTDSFIANPLFNAYFYRSAIHILRRYWTPPFLVLEHRVDTARRILAADASLSGTTEARFLAAALVALCAAAPVARARAVQSSAAVRGDVPPNIAVFAIACVALLFAEAGKPTQELDEDQFFAVVAALIAPRLESIAALIAAGDVAGLARELSDIKAMY